MLGDAANHSHNAVALDDLALIADLFYTCSYFHDLLFLVRSSVKSISFNYWKRKHTQYVADATVNITQRLNRFATLIRQVMLLPSNPDGISEDLTPRVYLVGSAEAKVWGYLSQSCVGSGRRD